MFLHDLRRWDVPPREMSPAAKSEEKRMFSQATIATNYSNTIFFVLKLTIIQAQRRSYLYARYETYQWEKVEGA